MCDKMGTNKKNITTDQASWVMDIFDRLIKVNKLGLQPVSFIKEASKVSALIELCEVLHIELLNEESADSVLAKLKQKLYNDKGKKQDVTL